jgi:hypothetical protein
VIPYDWTKMNLDNITKIVGGKNKWILPTLKKKQLTKNH